MKKTFPSILVISGPTGSGKSALALQYARAVQHIQPCEILCADSITVYRGFEIGATKPSHEEQKEFPHHLLDLVNPEENFTAGDFVRHAQPLIHAIHQRGALPILVGGSGFYLRALLKGMSAPEENGEKAALIKKELENKAAAEGYDFLYRKMLQLDPASIIHPNDHYRIIRALQAMQLHGKPWSELNKKNRQFRSPNTRFFCLSIDRLNLQQRIEIRTNIMLKKGLLEEAQKLLQAGVSPLPKPMLSIGYKECVEVLEGKEKEANLKDRIIHATMKFAKQQGTWFRGEEGVEWLSPDYLSSLMEKTSPKICSPA